MHSTDTERHPPGIRSAFTYGLAVALASLGGCHQPFLIHCRLDPPQVATSASGAVEVKTAEVATTAHLYGWQPQVSEQAEVTTHVEIENRGDVPVVLPLATWRLVLTGPGGHSAVGVPTNVVERAPGFSDPQAQIVAPVTLAPRQKASLWVRFRGLGGVPTDGSLALRLETGGATPALALATPAGPGPRWARRVNIPVAVGVSLDLASGPNLNRGVVQLQFYSAWRRLIFGYSAGFGILEGPAIQSLAIDDGPRRRLATVFAPRLGWHLESWDLAVMAGPEFVFVDRSNGPDKESRYGFTTATISVRLPTGPRTPPLLPLPMARAKNGLSAGWVDLGYLYWFGRGALPSGHGLFISFAHAHLN